MEAYNSIGMGTILSWAEVFATVLTITVLVGIAVFVLVALSGMRRESRREAWPGAAAERIPAPPEPQRHPARLGLPLPPDGSAMRCPLPPGAPVAAAPVDG
jgi:hypothetical protein